VISPLFWRVAASSLRVGDMVATDDTLSEVRRVVHTHRSDGAPHAFALLSPWTMKIPMLDDVSVARLVRWPDPRVEQ
jgi:hypothetical protein